MSQSLEYDAAWDRVQGIIDDSAASELANSFPFDPYRTLRGPDAIRLLDHCLAQMKANGDRQRQRKERDDQSHRRTVEAILVNLIAGALNRMDDSQFVAISKNRNDYVGTGLSYPSLQKALRHFEAKEWIECERGFYNRDHPDYPDGGRRTRMRATLAFCHLIDRYGITRGALGIGPSQLIRLKGRTISDAGMPSEIEASRALLLKINAKLATTEIALPESIWSLQVSQLLSDENDSEVRRRYRRYAGDLSAVTLYRVFNEEWGRGGRLYGGWWMSIKREYRKAITIEGRKTVELDYGQLHPTILYRWAGSALGFDPYVLPGLESTKMRDLGKRTFNRLINGTGITPLRASRGDPAILPANMKFAQYRDRLIQLHQPIARWFRTGVGLELQREDSDLALDVLGSLYDKGIVALPIHDSFLVSEEHSNTLKECMIRSFRLRYGIDPLIKIA